MDKRYAQLLGYRDSIRQITDFKPAVALVLGSGLGDYADSIRQVAAVDYRQLPGFPTSTVAGHRGRFVFGYAGAVPVVVMQGRVHYYEGYSMEDVVLPIRLMGLLGAKALLLTNAAGGINPNFRPGDFMLIRDHISFLVPSPLVGPNIPELGERFFDMTQAYDPDLAQAVREAAQEQGIPLQEGVYVQTTGPAYETPAEVRLLAALGADAVGMSTVCEVLAARHMGLRVCGISCISNAAAGLSAAPLSHQEVQETADRAASQFKALVTGALAHFNL